MTISRFNMSFFVFSNDAKAVQEEEACFHSEISTGDKDNGLCSG